jgi:2-alkyl-3-oxoalkanoate reductase
MITGATGFVGAHLTRFFSGQGHQVLAWGRAPQPPKFLTQFAEYQQIVLNEDLSNIEADMVIHVAALASDSASYQDLYDSNVLATRYLVRAARQCPLFVLLSSSSVYSYADNIPKKEADAGRNFDDLTNYGKTKYLSELELLKDDNPNQKRLITRPRAIYGVGDRVILPRLLGLQRGNSFIQLGHMNVHTSQTHVQQIAALIAFWCNHHAQRDAVTITNLADATPYHMRESVYELLCYLSGRTLKPRTIPVWVLKAVAATGLSSNVTKFLVDSMTRSSVLDLSYLQSWYEIPKELHLSNEKKNLKAWIDRYGGIGAYLRAAQSAPWMV